MQQFEASILVGCFNSVLQAVVHALDNPIGSLSTTFEAMQVELLLRMIGSFTCYLGLHS
jgi:telomere-associated protein RIF1